MTRMTEEYSPEVVYEVAGWVVQQHQPGNRAGGRCVSCPDEGPCPQLDWALRVRANRPGGAGGQPAGA